MAAIDLHSAVGWIDRPAFDADGRRLGRVASVLCDADGRPWWVLVRRRFGRTVVAPVDLGRKVDGGVSLDVGGNLPDAPAAMTERVQAALLRHFGLRL